MTCTCEMCVYHTGEPPKPEHKGFTFTPDATLLQLKRGATYVVRMRRRISESDKDDLLKSLKAMEDRCGITVAGVMCDTVELIEVVD